MHQLDVMQSDIQDLKKMVASFGLNSNSVPPVEIVDQDELSKRLAVTKPTILTWEKRGKIPALRLGATVRYNWYAVIAALEKQ